MTRDDTTDDERAPRPTALDVDTDAIPETLRDREQWIVWRYEYKPDRDEWTKPPIQVGGGYASSTDPDTWTAFEDAVEYHERDDTDTDGLGFVLSDGGVLVGLDYDDCRDPDSGGLEAWAAELLDDVTTYTEVSPSGTGLRQFGIGIVPDGGKRGDVDGSPGHVEMYDGSGGRYLSVTGQHVAGTPAGTEQVNDAVADVHARYVADDDGSEAADETAATADGGAVDAGSPGLKGGGSTPGPGSSVLTDAEIVEKAKTAENGDLFADLWDGRTPGYESHSEADMALCGLLAFWTGGDRQQMDRLFRKSGLCRDKWDEDRGAKTYGELTIDEALDGRTEFYEPGDDDAPPVERVDSDLVDALLDEPDAWIDADAKTWTVRSTDDHGADAIVSAVRDGELPGDAWDAFADAVISGDLPDAVADAVSSWRDDPNAWTVETSHEFDDTELTPDAVAAALDLPLSELGEERNGRLAYHVWDRIRAGEHAKVIARTGEEGDDELLQYDPDSGVWREEGGEELRTLGRDALGEAYSSGVRTELEEQVRATRADGRPYGQKPMRRLGSPDGTIPVANGTLDVDERAVRPRRPTDYALVSLPVEYDPDADCPTFDEFLTDVCPRPVDRKKLQEYVGYTLLHWDLPFHKALFLAGPQASGKSTFLDAVAALLGADDDRTGATCSLAPQEMTEERFAGYGLRKAWANIRSDIPADLIQNTGKFKELVAGDAVKVEQKYKDPVTIRPTAKHLFAANTLPSADLDDDAFFRRILLVSFPTTVPRDERDPYLDDKLEAELSGILNWALDGLDRLREQGHFSGDLPPAATQDKWRAWGESISRFKQRCLADDPAPDATLLKSDAYEAYQRFCEAEAVPVKSRQKFGREMLKDAGETRVTVKGQRKQAYVGVELLDERVPDPDSDDDDRDGDGRQSGLF